MGKKCVFLILIIIIILAIFLPVASGQSSEKVVIKVLAHGDPATQEGKDWFRIVESFEKENADIDIQSELLSYDVYQQKVNSNLALGGQSIPDLAFMGADSYWGDPWNKAGQQFDHRPYLDNNYYDLDLIPAMGENGEIWEIPISTSIITTVLYMNRELVNSLGFSTPKTYQDLVDMVPKARAAGLHIVSINGIDGWTWGSCLLSCIIARMSGDAHWVSKAVAGQRKFTDKAFIDSLAMILQMIKDGVISQETLHFDYGTNINNYNTEKALFMVQGLWAAGSFDSDIGVARVSR